MRGSRARSVVPALTGLLLAAGCASVPAPFFQDRVPFGVADPAEVDAVVFLIGDAGGTDDGDSPVLGHLTRQVEGWSRAVENDSSVAVLFMGDNVYPVGVRDRGTGHFPTDSARLARQVAVFSGAATRARGTRGFFLPGNHDWGNAIGDTGIGRLLNQQELLDSMAALGAPVRLRPRFGAPGPDVVDLGERVRLVLADTNWFLQNDVLEDRTGFTQRILEAMGGAEGRSILFAAHHPYSSAGPHGPLSPGARALGLLFLMKQSGTLVQDLNSPIYTELVSEIRATFRASGGPPLIFAGGHDHSLQVLDGATEDDPRHVLVSGAGSKISGLGHETALRWGISEPGYMFVVYRRDGGVELHVVAGSVDDAECPGESGAFLASALLASTSAECTIPSPESIRVRYSELLRAPGPSIRGEVR